MIRRVLQAATPLVPDRVLIAVNRHPRLRRVLRQAFTPAPREGLVVEQTIGRGPGRGRRILVDMGSDERRLVAGTYEPWVHSALPEILRDGMSMWDIGAHIGYYLIVASALSPSGHHLALEPDPANIERLRHNLALNDLTVEVVEAAVSDRAGEARFAPRSALGRISANGDSLVPAVPLDALLDGRRPPQVVMMDIEGGEGVGVPTATRLLDEVRPTWLMELHGDGGLAAYERLVSHGYAVRMSIPGDITQMAGRRLHAVFTPK